MAENPVINVLRRGQESTDMLKEVLVRHKLPSEVKLLLEEITGVFSEAVAMSQNVVASPEPPLPGADENGMYTNSKKKRRIQVAPKFSGRKRAVANSCNKVTLQTMDDGFTWRKYGQKEIFSAKYPRSYFRCTHKYDQNCLATRQVQLCEQQPDMYEITYFGEHTCNQAKKLCQEKENPSIIDFNSNTNNTMQHFSSSPPLSSSIKNEQEEEVMSNQTSPGSINTTSPDHQPVIDSDYLGLDLEYINLRDSLSMEFDNGGALEFGNIESMFSCSQFESLFQNIDC